MDFYLHIPIDFEKDEVYPTFEFLSKKLLNFLEGNKEEQVTDDQNGGGRRGRNRTSEFEKFYKEDDKYRWINTLSWSFGASSSSGGKSQLSELSVMIYGDSILPILQGILCSGERFPTCILNGVSKKDNQLELLEYVFTNATASSFQLSASSERPMCSLSLSFDAVEVSYYIVDLETGDITSRTTSKYDTKSEKGCRSLIGGKLPQPKSLMDQAKSVVKLNIKNLTSKDLNSLDQLKIFDDLPVSEEREFPKRGIKLNMKVHGKENVFKELHLKTPTRKALIELIAAKSKEKPEDIEFLFITSRGIDVELEDDKQVENMMEGESVRYESTTSKDAKKPEVKSN